MPPSRERRAADILNAVDGLLRTHLEGSSVGARALANLAVTMAIEYSGARWGALLEGGQGVFHPTLKLGEGAAEGEPDAELVATAATLRRLRVDGRRLAAAVLESGRVAAVLYLEFPGPPAAEAVDLARAVATRIGALLQSTHLVEELSRRTRNVALLEGLGACLAAGTLADEDLDRALQGAAVATGSPEGILAITGRRGGLLRAQVFGEEGGALRDLAAALAERLHDPRGEPEELLAGNYLFEALHTELVPDPAGAESRLPVGFLLVRGATAPYGTADRSFFNAVVHLMNGALARLDFFRRAAEDPLTETGSRLALRLKLCEAQAVSLKTGKPFSVLLVDLDRFKEVNDRYGHLVGDAVLRQLAELLRSRLRKDDSVARFGGDEFVLILPLTGSREAGLLAEELRELITSHRFTEHDIAVSVSVGVSTHQVGAHGVDDVLRSADEALYAAKSAGRDRVSVARGDDSGDGS